jgi:hypothetical protein
LAKHYCTNPCDLQGFCRFEIGYRGHSLAGLIAGAVPVFY